MSCLLISENSVPVGFITKWDFGKFLYIEHFAIALDRRGQGAWIGIFGITFANPVEYLLC